VPKKSFLITGCFTFNERSFLAKCDLRRFNLDTVLECYLRFSGVFEGDALAIFAFLRRCIDLLFVVGVTLFEQDQDLLSFYFSVARFFFDWDDSCVIEDVDSWLNFFYLSVLSFFPVFAGYPIKGRFYRSLELLFRYCCLFVYLVLSIKNLWFINFLLFFILLFAPEFSYYSRHFGD